MLECGVDTFLAELIPTHTQKGAGWLLTTREMDALYLENTNDLAKGQSVASKQVAYQV